MKYLKVLILFLNFHFLFLSQCSYASSYEKLVFNYAPIHYQATDGDRAFSDFITAIDYDGDWISDNNWDNFYYGNLSATVNYMVVESENHFFITYAFFHPQDWAPGTSPNQEHENDLEGIMLIVEKTTGTAYGKLQAAISVFHKDFHSFIPADSDFQAGSESIDGEINFKLDYEQHVRAISAQEPQGHGAKMAQKRCHTKTGNCDYSYSAGIHYYPSRNISELPSGNRDSHVLYKLTNIFGKNHLWQAQLDDLKSSNNYQNGQFITFDGFAKFDGDSSGGCGDAILVTCHHDGANAPWGWDDWNDGDTFKESGLLIR